MNITLKQIKSQYKRVKRDGWLPWFAEAAEKAGTTTAHFLAIGSRETNLENIKGDFRGGHHHGYGPMQIDVGTDAEFAKNWTKDDPAPGIKRGGEIYKSKVDQIRKGQGKTLKVKGKSFVGRTAEPDDIRRIATAAYNCGLWAYYYFSNRAHVDMGTTGKDYSQDVYDRALEFAELLETDGEEGAFAREIELQGKYATEDEKARVKQPLVTDSVTESKADEPEVVQPEAEESKPEEKLTPAAEAPSTPVPEGITVQKVVQSLGSKVMAGGTVVMGALTALGGAFLGVIKNPYAFAVLIVGCAALGVYAWNKSKDRQLKLQLDLNAKASSKELHTIVVKPPELNTE